MARKARLTKANGRRRFLADADGQRIGYAVKEGGAAVRVIDGAPQSLLNTSVAQPSLCQPGRKRFRIRSRRNKKRAEFIVADGVVERIGRGHSLGHAGIQSNSKHLYME